MKTILSQGFKTLATRAVESAEANFGAGKGCAKKRFAVNFVLARVPMPYFLREILDDLLVEVIGIAVENACEKFNETL